MDNFVTIIQLFIVFLVNISAGGSNRCDLPESWRGKWFQGGRGEVIIREHSISGMGVCREVGKNDFYLLENKEENCMTCVLIMEQHHNILQYKQGYCIEGTSMKDVCQYLNPESPLFTLVRDPSLPIECPIMDAYEFTYNNLSGGDCKKPVSSLWPCASGSKYNIQFKRCDNVLNTFDQEMKLECLATWKHGSEFYLYGGFTADHINTKEDRFRCFNYKILGSKMKMTMSEDPSCRGISSQEYGSVVFELKKGTKAWTEPNCKFPEWLEGRSWRDLSGKHIYTLSGSSKALRVQYKRKAKARAHIQKAFRCVARTNDNSYPNLYAAVSLTSEYCTTVRQCIRIYQRDTNVAEIHLGLTRDPSEPRNSCTEKDFENSSKHLLVPVSATPEDCPLSGKFILDNPIPHCTTNFHSSCNSSWVMGLESNCKDIPKRTFQCIQSWDENGHTRVIASKYSGGNYKQDAPANCFIIEENGKTSQMYTDEKCNIGAPNIFSQDISYVFRSSSTKCNHQSPNTHKHDVSPPPTESKVQHSMNDLEKEGLSSPDSSAPVSLRPNKYMLTLMTVLLKLIFDSHLALRQR